MEACSSAADGRDATAWRASRHYPLRAPDSTLIFDSKHLGSPLEEEVEMAANPHDTRIHGDKRTSESPSELARMTERVTFGRSPSEERPPWIEEAADPTWWDVAFGSYGDGYLEWVGDHYFWDPLEPRTVADTRSLWGHRTRLAHLDEPWLAATLMGRDATAA